MRSVETTCSRGFRDRGGLFLNLLAEGPIGQITCPAQSAFGKGDRPGAYSTDAEGLSTLVNAFGRDPRPVRSVTVAAYINDRARAPDRPRRLG